MGTTYPTTIQTFSNPTSTDLLENATTALDHDYQHTTENDTLFALQTKVGVDGSAVTTTHDYKLSGVATGDKAVSKTGVETLTNKTLTAPQINFGSDSAGDMIYRGLDGVTKRLALGTTGQILNVDSSGIPAWIANPAAADSSTTVKGVVEIATTAEITAGTGAGGTGAILVVPASAVGSPGASKLVQFTGAGLYPAADGSLITNIIASNPSKIGLSAATTTITASGESTVASATVPANTLGTANAIRLRVFMRLTQGVADTVQFKCKYGTTTMITGSAWGPSGATPMSGYVEFMLFANASTSAQYASMIQMFDYEQSQASTETTNAHQIGTGTATENSTGALTIALTITNSGGNITAVVYGAVIEKIY